MARVVLAMSGGVDSSVAAHLLGEAGHEVIGVFMRHGQTSPEACSTGTAATAEGSLRIVDVRGQHKQGCCSAADADDARRVADRMDIPFYAINFQEEFERIIDYFVEEYSQARTPNPCVVCNNDIKFGRLLDYADSVDAQFVATGHYARLTAQASGENALRRGRDEGKDQSYVLFGLDREVLPRVLFPVGDYRKARIRQLASRVGLRVAEKKDSQEICFVPSGRHWDLVRSRHGDLDTSGEIVTTDGQLVGRHDGLEKYTIGQRKGLRVAMGEPYYVVRLEQATRRVVIGRWHELARTRLTADRTNWLVDPPSGPLRCSVQIRYNSTATPATARVLPGDRMEVLFDEPRHGVAPGQAVVCYDGDRVLGGGWIEGEGNDE